MFIAKLEQLVSEELQKQVWDQCQSSNWEFGHGSGSEPNAVSFWKMDFDDNPVLEQFWLACKPECEKLVNKSLRVIRQYANGHTYGLGGRPHADDSREGCYTLLYYPMPKWDDRWDGETVFYDENREIYAAINPAPNRGILFDSRILHVGRAPSRYYGGLRVTVAFKLEIDPDSG